MVNNEWIYCSGTTMATFSGAMAYLEDGMIPSQGYCMEIMREKGADQGMHNVLLHRYSADTMARLRAVPEERMARPTEFLDFIEAFQSRVTIDVTYAEEGTICTVAQLMMLGLRRDPARGYLMSAHVPTRECAIVHQFDRDEALTQFLTKRFRAPE